MTLKEEIIKAFEVSGWINLYVNYVAITKVVNQRRARINNVYKKASSVERCVRQMAQDGVLISNGRGDFLYSGRFK